MANETAYDRAVNYKNLKAPKKEPGVIDSFSRGVRMHYFELNATLNRQKAFDLLEEEYPDELKLSPEEIKKRYDRVSDKPKTERRIFLEMEFEKERDKLTREFAETGFQADNLSTAFATWAGAGVGTSLDVGNIIAEIALGLTAGPVAAGLKNFVRTSNTINKIRKRYDKLKKAELIRKLPQSQRLAKMARNGQKKAKDLLLNDTFGNLARVGTANALTEVAIHNVEAQMGNKYDLGPAVALGMFAPVFLRGMGAAIGLSSRALGKGTRSLYNNTPKKNPQPKVTSEELIPIKKKVDEGKPLTDKDIQKVTDFDPDAEITALPIKDDLKYKKDVILDSKNADELVVNLRKTFGEEANPAIKEIEAIKLGDKIFKGEFSKRLAEMAANMILSNHRVNPLELYPFMRNKSQLTKALDKVRKQRHGKKFKEHDVDEVDLVNLFTVSERAGNNYHVNNKLSQPVKQKVEVPEAVKKVDARAKELIEPNLTKTDLNGQVSRTSKDILDAVDGLVGCIRKGGPTT